MKPIPTSEPPAPSEKVAVLTRGLVRRFGDFTAVDNVDLRVQKGEVFGFLGPNGSGKTTVIKMLTGLLPMTAGDAWVNGFDVRKQTDNVRESLGYMSQKFSLYDDLTVTENLNFYGMAYGIEPARLRQRMPVFGELGHVYASHEIGCRKPDAESYLHVLKAMNIEPQRTVFIDDLPVNIEAARKVGMHAIHATHHDHVQAGLTRLGVL